MTTEKTYNQLFCQVMEVVEDTFPECYEEHFESIAKFLIHQGVDDTTLDTVDAIKDYHIAKSISHLFNWIHNGNETPCDIKNAPYPDELGNVLVLDDGVCIFWYEIGTDKEPYTPYEETEMEY